jgi:hypothetical protein
MSSGETPGSSSSSIPLRLRGVNIRDKLKFIGEFWKRQPRKSQVREVRSIVARFEIEPESPAFLVFAEGEAR